MANREDFQNLTPLTAARHGTMGKVVSMQHMSFFLLYPIFPSFPHAREKSGMSPEKKTVLREKFGSR